MLINPIIQAFLSSPFMMSTSEVAMMNVLAERYLNGTLTAENVPDNSVKLSAFKAKISSDIIVGNYGNMDSEDSSCCPILTTDGVLLFPILGTIMKESYYGAGTAIMRNWITQAAQDVKVKLILFYVNSGGGEVSGTWELANDIANFSKPKHAFVDGMACSATYYLICSCDEIHSSSPDNMVGSIGVTQYVYDRAEYYAAAGIKDRYVYADTSPQKHGGNRALEDGGNEQVMKDNILNPIDQTFMDFVHAQRPQVSKNALQGLEVIASKALADKTGLVDDITDFQTVYSQISPKKNTQMSKVKLICEDGIVASVVQKIPGVLVISAEMETAELQAVQSQFNEVTALNATAQAKVIELEAIVATHATTVKNSATQVTELEEAVTAEKALNVTLSAQLLTFIKPVATVVPTPVAVVVPVQAEGITSKVGYVKNPSTERKNTQFVS